MRGPQRVSNETHPVGVDLLFRGMRHEWRINPYMQHYRDSEGQIGVHMFC